MDNIISFFTENFVLITAISIAFYVIVSAIANKKGVKENGRINNSSNRNNNGSSDGEPTDNSKSE